MHHHLFPAARSGSRARFANPIDLAPHGMLPAGSRGTVRDRTDDVLTIQLEKPFGTFGDMIYFMQAEDLDGVTFRAPTNFHLKPIGRMLGLALLAIVAWETFVEPSIAYATNLPVDPIVMLFENLIL